MSVQLPQPIEVIAAFVDGSGAIVQPSRVGVVGAMMTIAHPGGTLMRRDGLETHVTNAFPPPANGTEWFFFLLWDEADQRFWTSYLEDGGLQVQHDGSLVTAADLTVRLRAMMSAETLAERLRALADGAR